MSQHISAQNLSRLPNDSAPAIERMITRAELEQERQRYFDLFEFAPDAYIVTDLNGKIFEANQTAAKLLNLSTGFLIGKPLTVFIKLPERSIFRLNLARLRTERGKWDWVTILTPRKRTTFTAHMHAAPVSDTAREITAIRWSIRDVTAQKNLEDKLRIQSARLQALSRHLVEAQEIERRQLARDLHDEIGQLLTGLKLTLEASQHQPEATPRHIANALGLIDGLMTQVRRLSLDLRPPMLDDLGLLASLHWSFDTAGSPAGDVPAPGLLVCDATGALTLHGAVEEGLPSVGAALADGSTATLRGGTTATVLQSFLSGGATNAPLYTLIRQGVGEAIYKVHSGSKFDVVTPTATSGARGTEFKITVKNNGETELYVIEGKVAFSTLRETVIAPLQQVISGLLNGLIGLL